MNKELQEKVNDTIDSLFENNVTPLEAYHIDEQKLIAIEIEYPHVSKQYPWPSNSEQTAA